MYDHEHAAERARQRRANAAVIRETEHFVKAHPVRGGLMGGEMLLKHLRAWAEANYGPEGRRRAALFIAEAARHNRRHGISHSARWFHGWMQANQKWTP